MNVMKEAVRILLLVMFIDGLQACGGSSSYRGVHVGWKNNGRSLDATCGHNQSIQGLTGDWSFYCSNNPKAVYCFVSDYLNQPTEKIHYVCPIGGYIRGIIGSTQDVKVGRRYWTSCCHDNKTQSHDGCYWTGWQSCFESNKPFRLWVPDGYYMAGIRSEYQKSDRYHYSRIWDFYVCK